MYVAMNVCNMCMLCMYYDECYDKLMIHLHIWLCHFMTDSSRKGTLLYLQFLYKKMLHKIFHIYMIHICYVLRVNLIKNKLKSA